MNWISLVCLLALSSPIFGRKFSAFNTFSAQSLHKAPPSAMNSMPRPTPTMITGQNSQFNAGGPSNQFNAGGPSSQFNAGRPSDQMNVGGPSQLPTGYGQQNSYGASQELQRPLPSMEQPRINIEAFTTNADALCRGKQPDIVIPLGIGNKFVVCIGEDRGVEQDCPRGLYYNTDTSRCEHKLGASIDPCASQPCSGGGKCIAIDSTTYECQCTPGFDGKNCELDARVCQTQQPCGQAPGTRCQSFHWGSALDYVCIIQGGLAYGLNSQQAHPNPCRSLDGIHPLGFSDKGFIKCDGEQMFIHSCPGGTVWDELNNTCVWPEQALIATIPVSNPKVDYGYSQQPSINIQPPSNQIRFTGYGGQ